MTVMWVFLAGGLGSAARYLIGLSAAAALGVAFPYGTLIVNLSGCFALGMVVQLASAGGWHGDVRAARCDIEPATKELDWRPKWALEEGLRVLLDWIGEQPGELASEPSGHTHVTASAK